MTADAPSLALAALTLACACAPPQAPTTRPAPPPTDCAPRWAGLDPAATTVAVTVRAELPAAARPAIRPVDHLIVSWLAPDEAAALREHGRVTPTSIVPFVARAQVFTVDPDRLLSGQPLRCPLALSSPAEAAVPVAVYDHLGAFWPTLMGHPRTNLVGVASAPVERGAASIALRLREPPQPTTAAPPWHCDGDRFEHLLVPAPRLGGDVHVCAYLPASYATAPRRTYPVVYLLSGLAGDELTRLRDRTFLERADALARDGAREAIFVGVDTRSAAGSWYFSAADEHGYEQALTDVIARVDATFRTDARPAARAVLGQSTGGFNAIHLAMLRPGLFGAVTASAPDALDLEDWLLAPDGRLRPTWLAWLRLEDAVQGPGQMRSYAAAWSTPDAPWPADLATGAPRPEVLARWLANSPARLLGTPAAQDALRGLAGRLVIGAADNDEFGLFPPARRFADRLTALGIPHTFLVDHHGHFGVHERLGDLLDRTLRALPQPRADAAPPAP